MSTNRIEVEEFKTKPAIWSVRYPCIDLPLHRGRWRRDLFQTETEAVEWAVFLQEYFYTNLDVSWRGFNKEEAIPYGPFDPYRALRHFPNL